jgi:Cys-tRNA(Pro)/Cys-tRNA(Cys) deacylase
MKKTFPTVIHESVLRFPQVIISGGRIGAQIMLAPADLLRAASAKTADILKEETV